MLLCLNWKLVQMEHGFYRVISISSNEHGFCYAISLSFLHKIWILLYLHNVWVVPYYTIYNFSCALYRKCVHNLSSLMLWVRHFTNRMQEINLGQFKSSVETIQYRFKLFARVLHLRKLSHIFHIILRCSTWFQIVP